MGQKLTIPATSFLELLPEAICVINADDRLAFASTAFSRIFGYEPEEIIGMPIIDLVHPGDRERTLSVITDIMAGHAKIDVETRCVRKDGEVAHVMWSSRWLPEERVRIAIARNITQHKNAEALRSALYALSEAAHVANSLPDLFERMHHVISTLLPNENFSIALRDTEKQTLDFVYHTDQYAQPVTALQHAAERLYAEVVSSRQPLLACASKENPLPPDMQQVGNQHTQCWLVVPLLTPENIIGALFLRSYDNGVRYTAHDKEMMRFISTQIATAVERKQLYARLQHASQYDPLTDLPNRGLLFDRLKTALTRTRRKQELLAVLYLDLDRFKDVNDTYGHTIGDLLLQEVARRLSRCMRSSDTVARVGGDEFVVLIENMQKMEDADIVVDKIHASFQTPIQLESYLLHIMPSIGIAHYPQHGSDEQSLIDHADTAMYAQKQQRKQKEQSS